MGRVGVRVRVLVRIRVRVRVRVRVGDRVRVRVRVRVRARVRVGVRARVWLRVRATTAASSPRGSVARVAAARHLRSDRSYTDQSHVPKAANRASVRAKAIRRIKVAARRLRSGPWAGWAPQWLQPYVI